jgi:hypothetical protein
MIMKVAGSSLKNNIIGSIAPPPLLIKCLS